MLGFGHTAPNYWESFASEPCCCGVVYSVLFCFYDEDDGDKGYNYSPKGFHVYEAKLVASRSISITILSVLSPNLDDVCRSWMIPCGEVYIIET